MAYSDKEIAQAYVEDMSKWVPVRKVKGVVQNTHKASGRITNETKDLLRGQTK